ncbi:hypothetical protein ScPMuIL_017407 [Solemya velum]
MAGSFVDGLNTLLTVGDGENQTANGTQVQCLGAIQHQTFYVFLLIPSVVLTLMFSFTWRRQYKARDVLMGRPAFVYPMDIMSRSNRFSYAAAFGAVTSLCAEVIFESLYAIDYAGPTYLKVFIALLSMLIYGIDYMPLFTSISVRNPIGYGVGSLYAWMFFVLKLYRIFRCEYEPLPLGILILSDVPELLCLAYLSISLPVRFGQSLYKRIKRQSTDPESMTAMVEKIQNSYQGIRVRKLLKRPDPERKPPTTLVGKLMSLVYLIHTKLIYQRSPDFRYSGRFLSVTVVSAILIYQTTIKLLVGFIPLFVLLEEYMGVLLAGVGFEPEDGEHGAVTMLRTALWIGLYFNHAVRICFIVSVVVAFVVSFVMILHSMASYRTNLLAVYRGDTTNLPPRESKSNPSLLVGCMRFAGYQIGYTAWAFIIQLCLVLLVTIVLAVIVTMFEWGFGDIFIELLMNAWPALLITLLVNVAQTLLAKFLFLRDSSRSTAIDNRRVFFILVYFMFFYNIFLGFISCLLRILKSVVIGALFMARLDQSTLPRRFEFMDPGFSAYVGLIYTERAHTHPVAIVFTRILLAMYYQKLKKKYRVKEESDVNSEEYKTRRRHMKAQSNWMMLYTLHNNPQLQCLRKDYIDMSRNKFRRVKDSVSECLKTPEKRRVSFVNIPMIIPMTYKDEHMSLEMENADDLAIHNSNERQITKF